MRQSVKGLFQCGLQVFYVKAIRKKFPAGRVRPGSVDAICAAGRMVFSLTDNAV